MANYLYNGIELPALPEWDKETCPYAVIIKHSNGYLFAGRSTAFTTAAESGYMVGEASVKYLAIDGVWTTSTLTVSGGVIWANHDIYLTADATTLVLAASDPIPVSTLDPKSLMMGWMVGKKIAAMRGKVTDSGESDSGETEEPSGTIVGYSYNGVTLPALPEYDSETYPYAYIGMNGDNYIFAVSEAEKTFNGSVSGTISFINKPRWKYDGTEWAKVTGATSYMTVTSLVWCNTDVYRNESYGGTLYLAASEPVPVYE